MMESKQRRRGRLILTTLVIAMAGCASPATAPNTNGESSTSANGNGKTGVVPGSGTTATNPAQPGTTTGTQPTNGTAANPAQPGTHTGGHVSGQETKFPDGWLHKDEFTQWHALKGVAPQPVSAAAGATLKIDGFDIVIPPGALGADGQVRFRKIDNSDRPILPQKVPGMSFWMDLGAPIADNQAITVTGPVEDKFIEELKRRDPKFDASKYSLKQENGKWMLTMRMEGAMGTPQQLQKLDTPYYPTVDTVDPTMFPITWFSPDGPTSNTGFKLMGTDGTDHLDGFQTFDDLAIADIHECLTPEEKESDRYQPIDTTKVKTKDANGNVIFLDAGKVDPITGRWKASTGTSSFNPVTHQQNCDFADAGCPDSGAVAKALARFNHIITTKFPDDYKYPDDREKYGPLAGQPHPCAGMYKKPPADLMAVVDNYRRLDTACDNSAAIRVYAKAIWKSDIASVNNTPAKGPEVKLSFAGLEGQAGGEVTVRGRVRTAGPNENGDPDGMAFEALKGMYNAEAYYWELRNSPSKVIVGARRSGTADKTIDYRNNPVLCYIPRYSPLVELTLKSSDFKFENGDEVMIKYKIDGKEQIATEIVPVTSSDPSAIPGAATPKIVVANALTGLVAKPIKFFAKISENFNYGAGKDPSRALYITDVRLKRAKDGALADLEVAPVPASLAAAKWEPGTPSSGVWINGHYKAEIELRGIGAK